MTRLRSTPRRSLGQWPALVALALLWSVALFALFLPAILAAPILVGQKLAVVLFLLFLAVAEGGLLALANAGLETLAAPFPAKRLLDGLKAVALALALIGGVASLVKLRLTGVHLKVADLWFAWENFHQIVQEFVGPEMLLVAGLVVAFVVLAAGLFAAFRRLRDRPVSTGLLGLALLTGLAAGGAGLTYAAYPAVAAFAGQVVPEVHWLTGLAPGLPGLRGAEGAEEAAALAGPAIVPYRPGRPARPANVVLVMLESIPWSRTGLTGAPPGTTPNLDRLASESVVFSHAYTTSTHSDYAQMAILSSLFPRKYPHHDYYVDLDYPRTLLWDALKPAGYRTAMFSCQNEDWGNMRRYLDTPGLDLLRHSLDWPEAPHKGRGAESKVFEETPVRAWMKWREALPDGPYFTYLNFQATHFPYVIPESAPHPFTPYELDFPATFVRYPRDRVPVMENRFWNALRYSDHWLGEVIGFLRRRGEWDRTALVVVSDHGEAFYEHAQPTHGSSLYEEQVRSVLLMHLPGVEARTIDQPVSLADVPPTLLAYLGLPPHGNFQGRGDLLDPAYRGEDRPLFFTIQGLTFEDGLLWQGWKYTVSWDGRWESLYDLAADPGERRDLAATETDRRDRLRQALADFLGRQLDYYAAKGWRRGRYPPAMP